MSWNEVMSNNNGGNENKVERNYTKIPVGTVTVRCLDGEPKSKVTHWIPQANNGRGLSANCCGRGTCPACIANEAAVAEQVAAGIEKKDAKKPYPAKKVFNLNVINRADGKHEILEKGKSLFEQLKTLNDEIGPVTTYDVKIVRRGQAFNEVSYTCLPGAGGALTEAENNIVKHDLVELNKAWTPEQIQAALDGKTVEEIFPRESAGSDESVETA